MSIGYINSALVTAYRYAGKTPNRAENSVIHKTGFVQNLENVQGSDTESVEEYTKYLRSKYGNVSIRSVGKDQRSLERAGKGMSGNDVIIAPNILEEMANDTKKAAYYEEKIDYFFDVVIPRGTVQCAARGLVFEPCGVVVHEDGTVTYISGCSDSPERVAEVNAINKAKREKRAAQRREYLEQSQEAAERRKQIVEDKYYMLNRSQGKGAVYGLKFFESN